jgi:hypothetical protein
VGKPILCVDFDGVLHSYSSGWKGADKIPDPPVDGALHWLCCAIQHFEVHIYSSRSGQVGGIPAMKRWIEDWADRQFGASLAVPGLMAALVFSREKPAAFLTIDDRAICFDGNWDALDPVKLLKFQPWNKRDVRPNLGATGAFPQGKLNDNDEGELRMAVGYEPVGDIVRVEFGKPVAWLGLPRVNAVELANMLLRHAGAKVIDIKF